MEKSHQFRITQLKNKKTTNSILNKLYMKPTSVLYNDRTTVNFTKRMGGQVFQFYSINQGSFKI